MFSCYCKKPQNNNNKTKAVDIHIILKKRGKKIFRSRHPSSNVTEMSKRLETINNLNNLWEKEQFYGLNRK